MSAKTKKKPEAFEKSLERLETIVDDLESGEKGLEESLELFENGVGLAKELTGKLQDVKKRVEVLTKEGKGKFRLEALEEE
jgi:exodeoxyribonuclease VII small subunit